MGLSDTERTRILLDWNNTSADFPSDACLHQLFEENATARPDHPGVIYLGEAISYGELDRRSNILANYLLSEGVETEDLVGICLERSVEMVVAILGVLKAGAAYVPVDPAYPQDRIDFMLRDTHVSILLTQEHLASQLSGFDTRNVSLDADWPSISRLGAEGSPRVNLTSDNLCYIIYTSGSTGTPKGIVLRHQGVVNNIYDLNDSFGVAGDDAVLAISALGFDMCVYEVLGTLAAGGTIVMPEQGMLKDPSHWADLVKRHNVTVWNSAPALLEMLVDYVESRPQLQPLPIKLVIQGGDWEPLTLPDRLRAIAPGARVVVLGGATEASIHSTVYEVREVDPAWKSIPYGKPMRNQTAYILGENLEPLGIGEAGELHLGGIGLARGYFERAELTREKFIPHPFSDDPGERIYKTGDLARWMPDGNIELLGRMDFQVKVRGHRIELGEITECLRQHEQVEDAIVVMREDKSGDKRLVAYVVPRRGQAGDGRAETAMQINQWQEVYDHTYTAESPDEAELDFTGWVSSYTGLPFTQDELSEMLDHSVKRIMRLAPDKALEIGCGTGLILLNVARHCSEYQAADLSAIAIQKLARKVDRDPVLSTTVSLSHGRADDFTAIADDHFDTVIINSVVQHFPNLEYLQEVIGGAVDKLPGNGALFVGDVRNLDLLNLFHTSIECHRAADSTPAGELRQRVARRERDEKELVVAPRFFLELPRQYPRISHVAVVLKSGEHVNEFNKYHYDAYVHVGEMRENTASVEQLSWGEDVESMTRLEEILSSLPGDIVRVNNIPNRRLAEDKALHKALADGNYDTAGEIRHSVDVPESESVDPEDLWRLEEAGNFTVDLCYSQGNAEGSFDAVLVRKDKLDLLPINYAIAVSAPPPVKGATELVNEPYREKSDKKLVSELRYLVSSKLPDYMEPQNFVVLDKFPLTPNGKVDRNALPVPDDSRPELTDDYVAPKSPLEQVLCLIWQDVLELTEVGANDNFLSLGGHSLKATQIASRVNEIFATRINLEDIFESKTVAQLALRLASIVPGVQLQETAANYLEYSNLSLDELQSILDHETADRE